jgi:hypothetical protein
MLRKLLKLLKYIVEDVMSIDTTTARCPKEQMSSSDSVCGSDTIFNVRFSLEMFQWV